MFKTSKKYRRYLSGITAGIVAIAVAVILSMIVGQAEKVPDYERASLVRVVDGDTLVVNINGSEERVRLIGIDAPESVSPNIALNSPEGEAAAAYLRGLLTPGQTLWCETDKSDRDRYGRLLRYVWLERPQSAQEATEHVSDWMLNGVIVKGGHAVVTDYPPDTKYSVFLHVLDTQDAQNVVK